MILNFANILAEEAVSVQSAAEAVTGDTTAAATGTRSLMGGDMITTVVMMLAMVAIFYFLLKVLKLTMIRLFWNSIFLMLHNQATVIHVYWA